MGVFPVAWSNDPMSSMAVPAGMSRIEFPEITATGGACSGRPSGSVAAVLPLGHSGFHLGSAAGWNAEEKSGAAQLSGSYIVAGDPIGFMEGLFGPSITTGVSARFQFADTTVENAFEFDGGFQFSLFPSFAVGMLYTDILGDRVLSTGFSQVFNRNLKAHAGYSNHRWQVGCELTVTRKLKLFSGVDGGNMHAGAVYSLQHWRFGYGAVLRENEIEHTFGVSGRFM
jgi:hypothetical protein